MILQQNKLGKNSIYIWVNFNISLTWIKAIWGWFPLLTMIPVRSQWGRYNLPRFFFPLPKPGFSQKLLSSSDPHPDTLFWHGVWHTIWKYIWHIYAYLFWHSFWLILWHSIWRSFWHSIWLTFFLAFYPAFYRAFCLAFSLAWVRVQAHSTASWACDMGTPRYPELAIWSECSKKRRGGEGRGGDEGEAEAEDEE